MTDLTGQHADECPKCEGWGETAETAREMVRDRDTGVWKTLVMGYGCLNCGGTGRITKEATHE